MRNRRGSTSSATTALVNYLKDENFLPRIQKHLTKVPKNSNQHSLKVETCSLYGSAHASQIST